MNRREFLTSSIRGLILGAAISSGLGKTAIALVDERQNVGDIIEMYGKVYPLPLTVGGMSMLFSAATRAERDRERILRRAQELWMERLAIEGFFLNG